MSVDAVGGVWRYAMDLARGLAQQGYSFVFAGFGPPPAERQRAEAEAIGTLTWCDIPLDWTADSEAELDAIPTALQAMVDRYDIDLVHLNLPSQAAGLDLGRPVLVVSHSCVVTWFAAVRRSSVPEDWVWQRRRNQAGFAAADLVIAPSYAHAELLERCYGPLDGLVVVHNGIAPRAWGGTKEPVVFAAGRWWDDGKNGGVLDAATPHSPWPVLMAGATRGPNGQVIQLEHAHTLGELPHSSILDWMARAAIVASPSIYEPFGLAPLEAASAGAALVLADIPTYRELWDGAAMFADPHEPASFAAAIARLATDPALRLDVGANARARARCFSIDRQCQSMQSVYASLRDPVPAVQTA